MRTMALEFLKQGKQIVLLYGSRSQEDAAFLQELQELAAANPGRFKLVFSASGKGGLWTGRKGRVDKDLIAEQVCFQPSLRRLAPCLSQKDSSGQSAEFCYISHRRLNYGDFASAPAQLGVPSSDGAVDMS